MIHLFFCLQLMTNKNRPIWWTGLYAFRLFVLPLAL